MKIAIVGSRGYPEPEEVLRYVSLIGECHTIVSGGARGVDSWAAEAARERGLEVVEYPAKWHLYGRSAGFRRNQDIVRDADLVVAFWDGKSKGTKHTIDLALKANKQVRVVYP